MHALNACWVWSLQAYPFSEPQKIIQNTLRPDDKDITSWKHMISDQLHSPRILKNPRFRTAFHDNKERVGQSTNNAC